MDPPFYDSVPWEFYLLEADIETLREAFDDPKKCELYATDVHKTPFYCMGMNIWEFRNLIQMKQSHWTCFGLVAHPYFAETEKDSQGPKDPQLMTIAEKTLEAMRRDREKERRRKRHKKTEAICLSTDLLEKTVEDIQRNHQVRWRQKKEALASLSKLFDSRLLLFGYESREDMLYYELYEKGYWKESFMGGLYLPEVSTSTTFCILRSEIRPDCKPVNDEKLFVEKTFHAWNISIPFVSLLPDEKNKNLIKGKLPDYSVFSVDDIKGFDCALIPCLH